MEAIRKYPRTRHIEGSRLQPGDHDLEAVRFKTLVGRYLVVEEKLDGANAGLGFDGEGNLRLQSRGHYLTGGGREKHFALFKQWASCHRRRLRELLGDRYLVYGEWLYAKHTIFYDQLPHYFLEFDVFDREREIFLSTDRRAAMFADSPILSVPVLWRGEASSLARLRGLIGHSLYKSPTWRRSLRDAIAERGLDFEKLRGETDPSDEMEGLYIKMEEDGRVLGRYKYVRASFLTSVVESGSHWLARPIVPNRLGDEVDIFAPTPTPTPTPPRAAD